MKIIFWGITSQATGRREMEITHHRTVSLLIKDLHEKFPGLKRLLYRVVVNGKPVRDTTKLKNQDVIDLVPPFAGG